MIRECPEPREDCPFYDQAPPSQLRGQEFGCYSDLDHIVPQRLATDALSRWLIYRQENKQQLCRWEHIQKIDEPLPPREEIIQMIRNSGEPLSRKMRKALNNKNDGQNLLR